MPEPETAAPRSAEGAVPAAEPQPELAEPAVDPNAARTERQTRELARLSEGARGCYAVGARIRSFVTRLRDRRRFPYATRFGGPRTVASPGELRLRINVQTPPRLEVPLVLNVLRPDGTTRRHAFRHRNAALVCEDGPSCDPVVTRDRETGEGRYSGCPNRCHRIGGATRELFSIELPASLVDQPGTYIFVLGANGAENGATHRVDVRGRLSCER